MKMAVAAVGHLQINPCFQVEILLLLIKFICTTRNSDHFLGNDV